MIVDKSFAKLLIIYIIISTYMYTCINAILQMLNLDYEDIYATIPHYIWAYACNFSLFLYPSKKDTFFKFW